MAIYPENIEEKIDFKVVRARLQGACHSSLGKDEVDKMTFLTEEKTIRHLLAEADEMQKVQEDGSLNMPAGEIHDMHEALGRIRVEGLFMDEDELWMLRKTIDYAVQMEQFLSGLNQQRFPILSAKHLEEAISR